MKGGSFGERISLGTRGDEKGSFRVLSFEQANSSTDTCSLGIYCGQSFNSTHIFVCGLAF